MIYLSLGDKVRVIGFQPSISSLYRSQLVAMGFTPGVIFTVTRQAPLGDPLEISIRSTFITLRQSEAKSLIIEKINPTKPSLS